MHTASPRISPDAVLYKSRPFAYAQPASLAANAALLGWTLTPPAVERARVLELGCASGGNIIPLAVRFPQARFLGVDLSEAEVAVGQARAAALALSNFTLQAGDILDIPESGEPFDYIICHGVLSWVPKPVQEKIFRLCASRLADNGIAVISFNVRPGWNLHKVTRDVCLASVDRNAAPLEQVEQARAGLQRLSETVDPGTLYGEIIRRAAQRFPTLGSPYILGEYLAPINDSFFFSDFAAAAAAVGLHYLGEGQSGTTTADQLMLRAEPIINASAQGDRTATQTLIDLYSGRLFRRAMLGKSPPGMPGDIEKLRAAHISAALEAGPQPGMFRTPEGDTFRAEPEARETFETLGRLFPATLPVADLDAKALRNILQIAWMGRIGLFTHPLAIGRASDVAPRAFALARLEAREGQDWATSLRHLPANLSQDERILLPLLDGTRSHDTLAAALDPKAPSSASALERLRQALIAFERAGLLEAAH